MEQANIQDTQATQPVPPSSPLPLVQPAPPTCESQAASTLPEPVRKTNVWIAVLCCAVVLASAVGNYQAALDNDMWFLLATGREILTNGIPYVNPFTVYEGMDIIVQQWIPCVILYSVYSVAGNIGLGVLVFVLSLLLAFCAYKVGMLFFDQGGGEVVLIFVALLSIACTTYASIRPQLYSMIAFLLVVYVCERYRCSNNWRWLILLPLITAIHVNFHASLVLFDTIIAGCYLLPTRSFSRIAFAESVYRRIPLLIACVVMTLATLANPYTLRGALYLVLSYGAASYGNYINEMQVTVVWSDYGAFMMIFVLLGALMIGRRGPRHIDLPLTLLYLGTLVMSLQHIRNVWLIAIFSFVLVCSTLRMCSLYNPTSPVLADDVPFKRVIPALLCAGVLVYGIFAPAPELTDVTPDNGSTPVVGMDAIEADGADPATTAIFNHFNDGGYIAWRGYKCSIDPRPELWQDAIAGTGFDYYTEFVDMSNGKISSAEYLADKSFDYLIVNTNTNMYTYLSGNARYSVLVRGNGYTVFEYHESMSTADTGTMGAGATDAGAASTNAIDTNIAGTIGMNTIRMEPPW